MGTTERVSYRPEGSQRVRRVLLDDVTESTILGDPVLVGNETDRDGLLTGTRHIISASLVVKRQRMRCDLTYGHLVPAEPLQ